MKPLKKPSVKTPYETICELNPSWKSEMETVVKNHIKNIEDAIKKEAEKSGDDRMADEEFLYSRFKDNVSTGMIFANWEVLKYFSKMLICKWYYEHIGEWKYTEEDVEMYRYFRDIEVTQKTKCRKRFMKFNLVDEEVFAHSKEIDHVMEKSILYYELDDGREDNVITVNYFDLFHVRWLLIQDMILNSSMSRKYFENCDLFSASNLFRSITLENHQAYGHIKSISADAVVSNKTRSEVDNKLEAKCQDYISNLMKDKSFSEAIDLLKSNSSLLILYTDDELKDLGHSDLLWARKVYKESARMMSTYVKSKYKKLFNEATSTFRKELELLIK